MLKLKNPVSTGTAHFQMCCFHVSEQTWWFQTPVNDPQFGPRAEEAPELNRPQMFHCTTTCKPDPTKQPLQQLYGVSIIKARRLTANQHHCQKHTTPREVIEGIYNLNYLHISSILFAFRPVHFSACNTMRPEGSDDFTSTLLT